MFNYIQKCTSFLRLVFVPWFQNVCFVLTSASLILNILNEYKPKGWSNASLDADRYDGKFKILSEHVPHGKLINRQFVAHEWKMFSKMKDIYVFLKEMIVVIEKKNVISWFAFCNCKGIGNLEFRQISCVDSASFKPGSTQNFTWGLRSQCVSFQQRLVTKT